MADITDTLKSILGDDAGGKLKAALGSLTAGEEGDGADLMNSVDMDSINQLAQIKNMMDSITVNRNNPSVNLLMALKPYMRNSRKSSIDTAVRLIGMANIIQLFKNEQRR